jgi:hypothetical protein
MYESLTICFICMTSPAYFPFGDVGYGCDYTNSEEYNTFTLCLKL